MLPSILGTLRNAPQRRPTTTMPAAARERMSRVDTAWLRMDNDVNLMMIVGVWLLQPAIAYETLCERVAEKLLKYERFRQAVVRDATGAAYWVRGRELRHPSSRRARRSCKRAKGQSERDGAAGARRRAGERRRSIPTGRSGSST